MGSKKDTGDVRVVVRKVALGPAPYGWEVHDASTCVPRHVCPDRFKSMETAYQAGQAWLANFLSSTAPVRRVRTSGMHTRSVWAGERPALLSPVMDGIGETMP
jgi:hypothetical protein